MAEEAAILILGSSAAIMALGSFVSYCGILSPESRKGIAVIYSKIVFPTMVFKGLAGIELHKVDLNMAIIILVSKSIIVGLSYFFGFAVHSKTKGKIASAHAAAFAMAATHSFDVGMGVPLAKVLFPEYVPYVFLNQTLQLIFINPVLIICMELGCGDGNGLEAVRKGLLSTALNPVFFMTCLGIIVSEVFGGGLPPLISTVCGQITSSGPFLGFLLLGSNPFWNTSSSELGSAAVLNAFKMLMLPMLYTTVPKWIGAEHEVSLPFLAFLGALPATASVYSVCLTRQLSPRVIGPLIPVTLLLAAFFLLLPMWPSLEPFESPLRVAVLGSALGGGALALNTTTTKEKKQ